MQDLEAEPKRDASRSRIAELEAEVARLKDSAAADVGPVKDGKARDIERMSRELQVARNETERAVNVMRDVQFKYDRLEVYFAPPCQGLCPPVFSLPPPPLGKQGQKNELEQQVKEMKMKSEMESKSAQRKVAEAQHTSAELEVEVADLRAQMKAMKEKVEMADKMQVGTLGPQGENPEGRYRYEQKRSRGCKSSC